MDGGGWWWMVVNGGGWWHSLAWPKIWQFRVNKKEFHKSKQPINLDLVNIDQIVVFDKLKHSDDDFKYFAGYKEGEIVKLFYNILPQMSGYIKYFENGGKNISFVIKEDDVLDKHNKIWDISQWNFIACLFMIKIHKSQGKRI